MSFAEFHPIFPSLYRFSSCPSLDDHVQWSPSISAMFVARFSVEEGRRQSSVSGLCDFLLYGGWCFDATASPPGPGLSVRRRLGGRNVGFADPQVGPGTYWRVGERDWVYHCREPLPRQERLDERKRNIPGTGSDAGSHPRSSCLVFRTTRHTAIQRIGRCFEKLL
ncbi:hypothetical protein GE21DRAFT_7703 [Neurospora crassa]|uniref:Uncharacterized protein n=1 Tax=Neurospora crassa (strain ATCC 24698 / 74-OR23-1A / CBS 708.71 / DSM 1257 / FGSC 987) TaxID=367110 RepID=V5IMY7_NEUCR|nr:hypothetical protein NCU10673 [Neurospora crassa OR74A]ESA42539.1 hypothetical protein NCU10673 [Neurospora crassa OR74A]KHE78939.1 hypothetical protein GE21DRAFT_7703 [Neurospora crassa]|eukprot:XP_011394790.1 hypothetical protein NCU10673 [Neurospora crassa OR74A]